MLMQLLQILRCPFCGSDLRLAEDAPRQLEGAELQEGVLACECSAFPVVAGIPVLFDDYYGEKTAATALYYQQAGQPEQALFAMLQVDDSKQTTLRQFIAGGADATCCDVVKLFCSDDDANYFVFRFSDPTYVVGQAIWRALSRDSRLFTRPVLDVCGGLGHLTRILCLLAGGTSVVLTDLDFWKLWLARLIVAPDCQPVCCDANLTLPFADGAFSGIACSDAFHFLKAKRLVSREMVRLAGDDGIICLTHLHNRLCENVSAGMPVKPEWYRRLFDGYGARLFGESRILGDLIDRRAVDLAHEASDDDLRGEPAICLVATRLAGALRVNEGLEIQLRAGSPRINPLYRMEQQGETATLCRQFPTAFYEAEFAACKRYLPDRAQIPPAAMRALQAERWDDALQELSEQFLVLGLPDRYQR